MGRDSSRLALGGRLLTTASADAMLTLYGSPIKSGVVMAVVAVIDATRGINAVSPDLLEQGIQALRRDTPPADYPEAIVFCDTLAVGLSMKIPGVNTIGIAAQSPAPPGLEPDVPCVVGVEDLLSSVNDGDIVILDGTKGVVHMDPDPATLIHYQDVESQKQAQHKVFISSEHMHARTQTGEVVYIYSHVSSMPEARKAVEEGADGLIADLRRETGYFEDVMRYAPGKPIGFVVNSAREEILRAAMRYAAPDQVTLLFSPEDYEPCLATLGPVLERLIDEAIEMDEELEVNVGIIADPTGFAGNAPQTHHRVVDVREVDSAGLERLSGDVASLIGDRMPNRVVIMIGERLDALQPMVRAGARSFAVPTSRIAEAKYAVRSIGLEEARS